MPFAGGLPVSLISSPQRTWKVRYFLLSLERKAVVVWLPFPLAVNKESAGAGMVCPVAEFIDPWLGDKVNSGIGLSYRHARLQGWRAVTTTLCLSWLYPPVRDYEFGYSAGIFKQYVGDRNRVGIGLSYWLARLHRLAELIPWNRFLGSLKV